MSLDVDFMHNSRWLNPERLINKVMGDVVSAIVITVGGRQLPDLLR